MPDLVTRSPLTGDARKVERAHPDPSPTPRWSDAHVTPLA